MRNSSACLISKQEKVLWLIIRISAKLSLTKSSPFRVIAILLSLRSPLTGCLLTKPSFSRTSTALETVCLDLNTLLPIFVGVMTPPCVTKLCKIPKSVGFDSRLAVSISRYLLNTMPVYKIDSMSSPLKSEAWALILSAKDSRRLCLSWSFSVLTGSSYCLQSLCPNCYIIPHDTAKVFS
jgi:hypothetical protein